MNLLLLVVGMILESIAAILIIAPIVAPALTMAGVDPLQLGIVFVLNLMIGLLTPPVGMSLYMITIITKNAHYPRHRRRDALFPSATSELAGRNRPFPALSTWLPNILMN